MLITDKLNLKFSVFVTFLQYFKCGYTWLMATVFSSMDNRISPSLVKALLDRGRMGTTAESLALDCHLLISSFVWFLCLFPFLAISFHLLICHFSVSGFLNSVRQVCNNSNYGLFPPEFLI